MQRDGSQDIQVNSCPGGLKKANGPPGRIVESITTRRQVNRRLHVRDVAESMTFTKAAKL